MIVDWDEIEQEWSDAATEAIVSTTTSNPAERFYAGAFWMLYGDRSSLHVPVFGLNSESSPADIRWHPPDWRWSIIDAAHERVRPLYEPLLTLRVDEATFDALWDRHVDMLAGVSRRLTHAVRSGTLNVDPASFSDHFFVGIIDFSQGDEAIDYLRRSADEKTILTCGILDE